MSDRHKKINKKLINKNLKILGHPKVQIVSEACCNLSVFSLFIAKEENSPKVMDRNNWRFSADHIIEHIFFTILDIGIKM